MDFRRALTRPFRRCQLIGPLPQLYSVLAAVVALVAFLGAGAWLGHLTVVRVPLPVGAVLGGLAGVTVAWAVVHDSQRRRLPVRGR